MPNPSAPDLIAALVDELPVGIWVGRVPSGEELYTNRAFQEILGMGPQDATRGNYSAKYSVHTRDGSPYPEGQMPFERAVRAGTTIVLDDLVIHRGDGSRVYLRVFAKPLIDAGGQVTHVLEAFFDITREVLAEQGRAEGEARLRQAQRMESVGNLAGGIAHDFNNLLATVRILSSTLRTGESAPDRLQSLDQIDLVTDSAVRLTRGLLGFARKGKNLAQPLSMHELLGNLTEIASRTFDRRIRVVAELGAASDVVLGDATQLEQVVMNLLFNARDAIAGEGLITVRTRDQQLSEAEAGERPPLRPGRHLVLEVSDTGTGIDPAIRERIFEPYFTTKTHGAQKGTGLGLATVYGIVQAHHGVIEVDQVLPHGATLRIHLPVHAAALAPVPTARPAPAPLRPASLLVVDDEPLVRAALGKALRLRGHRVLEAEDGRQALEVYRADGKVSAVILDMSMPGPRCRENVQALLALDPGARVLLVSGYALNEEAQEALDLGVRGFLAKPFDTRALDEALAQVLA